MSEEILQLYIKAKISREEAFKFIKIPTFYAKLRGLGYSQKTHIYSSKFGYIRKDNKEFFGKYHKEYLNNDITLKELGENLGITSSTLARMFERNEFKKKSKVDSTKTRMKNFEKTMIRKYGVINPSQVPEFKEKAERTCQERYGANSPLGSKIIQDKIIGTIREKYDDESLINVFQAKDVKDKIENTNIERHGMKCILQDIDKKREGMIRKYGVDHPSKSDDIKRRTRNNNTIKYGVDHPMKHWKQKENIRLTNNREYGVDWVLERGPIRDKINKIVLENNATRKISLLKKHGYEFLDEYRGRREVLDGIIYSIDYNIKHLQCGYIFKSKIHKVSCPKCYPNTTSFIGEEINKEYIRSLGFIISKKRILKFPNDKYKKEIDIYLEGLNIGFEYNHPYTHHTPRKDKFYHQQKTKSALEKGINLYHIWNYLDQDLIEMKVKTLLGVDVEKVGARELKFQQIENSQSKEFFDFFYLYGSTDCSISFGLFLEEDLITAISFQQLNEKTLEIVRFVTKMDYIVQGGFSKIFKNSLKIIKEKYPKINKIITHVDRDWSPNYKDTVYYKFGFKFLGDLGPMMFNTNLEKILTDQEVSNFDKVYPIYNSGNFKFEYKL